MKEKIRMYDILNTIEIYEKLTPDAIDDLHYIRDYINNLKKTLDEIESIVYSNISNIDCRISIQEVLDRMKENKK